MPLKKHSRSLWRSTEELGLGGGPGKEHSPIRENWDCNGAEMGFRRVVGKEESGNDMEGSKDSPGESQEEGTPSSASC